MTGPNLRADQNSIRLGACTNPRWDLENIQSVYFEGQPVVGHNTRRVCPTDTTTYTLLVQTQDGQRLPFQIMITVVFCTESCGKP